MSIRRAAWAPHPKICICGRGNVTGFSRARYRHRPFPRKQWRQQHRHRSSHQSIPTQSALVGRAIKIDKPPINSFLFASDLSFNSGLISCSIPDSAFCTSRPANIGFSRPYGDASACRSDLISFTRSDCLKRSIQPATCLLLSSAEKPTASESLCPIYAISLV